MALCSKPKVRTIPSGIRAKHLRQVINGRTATVQAKHCNSKLAKMQAKLSTHPGWAMQAGLPASSTHCNPINSATSAVQAPAHAQRPTTGPHPGIAPANFCWSDPRVGLVQFCKNVQPDGQTIEVGLDWTGPTQCYVGPVQSGLM